MIIDKILDFLFYFPMLLLETLLDFDLSIPDDVLNIVNGVNNFIYNVAYVIPFSRLSGILALSISISTLQILWALILRIKSFIPTMGA